MKKFWALFFMFWPLVAVWAFVVSPGYNWWFPYNLPSATPVGSQIDDLFYLILVIVAVVFVESGPAVEDPPSRVGVDRIVVADHERRCDPEGAQGLRPTVGLSLRGRPT